jgi:hypothetical protein
VATFFTDGARPKRAAARHRPVEATMICTNNISSSRHERQFSELALITLAMEELSMAVSKACLAD